MKPLIKVALCMLLTGCYQTANSYDIRKAIKQCGSIENVHEIIVMYKGGETFVCFEGSEK